MIVYEGFFINEELPHTLEKDIKDKHITTIFRPKTTNDDLYGITAVFEVIGYGINDDNEGYLVKMMSVNADEEKAKRLWDIYNQIEVPHITLSVSQTGKPINTRYLSFEPTDSRTLIGIYKGYC